MAGSFLGGDGRATGNLKQEFMAEPPENTRRSEGESDAGARARANAPMSLIAGLVFLYYGWFSGGWVFPADRGEFYRGTLQALDAAFRFGGMGLVAASALSFIGLRVGLMIDAVFSTLCAVVLLGGTLVLVFNDGVGLTSILFIVLSLVLGSSARSCWADYGLRPWKNDGIGTDNAAKRPGVGWFGRGGKSKTTAMEPVPEPIHPASLPSRVLPKDGEAAPAEGYLAALSREEEEPPRASYE